MRTAPVLRMIRTGVDDRTEISATRADGSFPTTVSLAPVLDALFADSREAVIVVDDQARVRYATPGVAMLLGHDLAAVTGTPVFDFVHPDDVEAAAQLFTRRLAFDGLDLGHETRVRRADGTWLPMAVTTSQLPGSELGTLAITIRSRHESEDVARSLRRRLVVAEYCNRLSAGFLDAPSPASVTERIDAALPDIALLTGADSVDVVLEHPDGGVERCARWAVADLRLGDDRCVAALRTDGGAGVERLLVDPVLTYAPSDLDALALFDREDQPGIVSLLSAPLCAGGRRGVLRAMRHRPGPDWIDADGELVRSAAAVFGRALSTARSEQLLALTYGQGPLGFSMRTWDGALVDCNERYLRLYEIERAEAMERSPRMLIPPEHFDEVEQQVGRLRRGEIRTATFELELERKGGARFWARVHMAPLEVPGWSEGLLVTSIEDASETRDQRVQLERAARYDSLTGLGNRFATAEAIERLARRDGELPCLLVVDVDRFKAVNESLGHAAGDVVLRAISDRISSQVRSVDLVARVGGDEFAVVVSRIDAASAERLAERLVRSLDEPVAIGRRLASVTASVGVALGRELDDPSDLLVRADRAVRAAKERGGGRFVVFDDSLHDDVLRSLALERDLRGATGRGELCVHFQPEFAIEGGAIVGAEALLRWHHPDRGLVPAGEFIAVAEQSGLIDEIGRYALREACRSFVGVTEQVGDPTLVLRVNISAREFARPELPDIVRDALAESGLDPVRLCLEMTETTLMDDPAVALDTVSKLQRIGVHTAIDDFGTGYSSMLYLKRFPVDCLKIDRTFVDDLVVDPDSRAIVASIVGLARAMHLETVAEGVETVDQLAVLRDLGCERAQGYLVAPALPPAELVELLRARGRRQSTAWCPLDDRSRLARDDQSGWWRTWSRSSPAG